MIDRPVRALVADDNPSNRQMIGCILRVLGLDVVEVCDGDEAVEATRSEKFDVILMDLAMPVMSGLIATNIIRQEEAKSASSPCNIIMITSHNTPEDRARSLGAGADHHIAKPIQAADIVRALATGDTLLRRPA